VAEYLKLPEVARRLDVSEKTARRYVKSGALPSVFLGGAYRVSEADLAEFLESARVQPGKVEAPTSRELSLFNSLEEERRQTLLEAFRREVGECADDAQGLAFSLKEVLQDQEVARARQLLAETGRRVQTCQRVFWPLVQQEKGSLPDWERELAFAIVEEHVRLWDALRIIRARMEADDRARRVLTEVAGQFENLDPFEQLVRHEIG
jgi:excisionase family DNA binding protein